MGAPKGQEDWVYNPLPDRGSNEAEPDFNHAINLTVRTPVHCILGYLSIPTITPASLASPCDLSRTLTRQFSTLQFYVPYSMYEVQMNSKSRSDSLCRLHLFNTSAQPMPPPQPLAVDMVQIKHDPNPGTLHRYTTLPPGKRAQLGELQAHSGMRKSSTTMRSGQRGRLPASKVEDQLEEMAVGMPLLRP